MLMTTMMFKLRSLTVTDVGCVCMLNFAWHYKDNIQEIFTILILSVANLLEYMCGKNYQNELVLQK